MLGLRIVEREKIIQAFEPNSALATAQTFHRLQDVSFLISNSFKVKTFASSVIVSIIQASTNGYALTIQFCTSLSNGIILATFSI